MIIRFLSVCLMVFVLDLAQANQRTIDLNNEQTSRYSSYTSQEQDEQQNTPKPLVLKLRGRTTFGGGDDPEGNGGGSFIPPDRGPPARGRKEDEPIILRLRGLRGSSPTLTNNNDNTCHSLLSALLLYGLKTATKAALVNYIAHRFQLPETRVEKGVEIGSEVLLTSWLALHHMQELQTQEKKIRMLGYCCGILVGALESGLTTLLHEFLLDKIAETTYLIPEKYRTFMKTWTHRICGERGCKALRVIGKSSIRFGLRWTTDKLLKRILRK